MKILIIRFSSIGDIVITSPIVRCIKKQYPDAILHFLTKPKFEGLVKHNIYVDKTIGLKEAIGETIDDLQNEEYDVVIDLHKNLRTRKIKSKLNTNWYTFNKLNIQKWLFVNFKINLLPKQHLVDRYFEGVESLHVKNDGLGLDYFLPQDYNRNLQDFELKKDDYIVISIGGTYATKRMPNSLILASIKRLNKPTVLIGGSNDDEQNARQITENLPKGKVMNLVNKLSIDDSAFLIKNCHSIISGDTGMLHIAAAYKKRISSVWGNTHPLFGMYAYLPEDSGHLVTNNEVDLKCRPCSKLGSKTCPKGHFDCMKLQNVEEIVKNCS
jgi:ADP-heptose:LPS heptosyltransferase